MGRRAARADGNQSIIVDDLRRMGCSVQHLHKEGMGCPDLLVGWRGRNFLFEVKDPSKPKGDRQLTEMQVRWHLVWEGHVAIIHSADDALEIMQGAFNEIPIRGVIT